MSDWQVGDLAMCIKMGPWRIRGTNTEINDPFNPTTGSVHAVSKTAASLGDVMLWFDGHGHADFQYAFRSDRFVKVTPPKTKQAIRTEQRA